MKPVIELVPIDDLDQAIVNLAARINAETYELLVLIRQFDERAGWLNWGSAVAPSGCIIVAISRSAPRARSIAAAARPLEISTLAEVAA